MLRARLARDAASSTQRARDLLLAALLIYDLYASVQVDDLADSATKTTETTTATTSSRSSRPAVMPYADFVVRAYAAASRSRSLRAMVNLAYVDSILVLHLTAPQGDDCARAACASSFDEVEVAELAPAERLRLGYFYLVYEQLYAILTHARVEIPMRGILSLLMHVVDGGGDYSNKQAYLRMRICDDVVQRARNLLTRREWHFVCDALALDRECEQTKDERCH